MAKAIKLSNTFRYKDDLFSVDNEEFGDNINTIYPSELELKNTSTSSNLSVLPQCTNRARVCTSKLDLAKRLRRLSSRLNQQGFKFFNKFFKHHGAIVAKYNTTLREMRRQSTVAWLLI